MATGGQIKQLIRASGHTQADVASNIGVSREYLNKLLKYETVDVTLEDKILQFIKSEPLNSSPTIITNGRVVEDPEFIEVPILSRARAGRDAKAGDISPAQLERLPKMLVPKPEEKGKYIIFEVTNDSMYDGTENSIMEGDRVLCLELDRMYWKYKLHFKKYFFVLYLKNDVIIKKITSHDTGANTVTCVSLNPIEPPFDIHLDKVLHLFYVKDLVWRKLRP